MAKWNLDKLDTGPARMVKVLIIGVSEEFWKSLFSFTGAPGNGSETHTPQFGGRGTSF